MGDNNKKGYIEFTLTKLKCVLLFRIEWSLLMRLFSDRCILNLTVDTAELLYVYFSNITCFCSEENEDILIMKNSFLSILYFKKIVFDLILSFEC